MIDSSSASARDRSSVVIVERLELSVRTRSSISSMSARSTRFALRSLACSGMEMTSSPLTVGYLSRAIEVPPGSQNIPPDPGTGETKDPGRPRWTLPAVPGPAERGTHRALPSDVRCTRVSAALARCHN